MVPMSFIGNLLQDALETAARIVLDAKEVSADP
jgi:hypothetical protein